MVSGEPTCRRISLQLADRMQGMQSQITKAVLSQALLFMSKERFEHWALAIMVLWWKMQHRKA